MGIIPPNQTALKSLPLQVRVGLRDLYLPEDSKAAQAIEKLAADVGFPVNLHVDWPELWRVLQPECSDPGRFVPNLSGGAVALLDAIRECCLDETWAEELLTRLQKNNKRVVDVYLRMSHGSIAVAQPHWHSSDLYFWLELPQKNPNTLQHISSQNIRHQVKEVFVERSGSTDTPLPAAPAVVPSFNSRGSGGGVGGGASGPAYALHASKIPALHDIARPEDLAEQSVPYLVTISDRRGLIEIQSTHTRTLETIAQFLEQHMQVNPNASNHATIAKVTRLHSCFGNFTDGLTIEQRGNYGMPPTAMTVLALLQGTLQYKLVHTDGITWVFKRDVAFL